MFSGIIIFFIVRSLWIFYQFLKRKQNYWTLKRVPGPKPTFLIGSFPSIVNKWRHNLDEISDLYEKFKDKTPFIGIYYGLKPALMILDSQIARNIMISDFSHFTDTVGSFTIDKEIDPLIGLNPFFLKGDEWKEKRSEISPAFSNTRIKSIFPLMEKSAIDCIETLLKTNTDLKNVEMREFCASFTTNVVASSVLGIESFDKHSYNLRNLSKKVLEPSFRLVYVLFLAPFFPGIAKRLKIKLCQEREENLLKELFMEAVKNRSEKVRNDFLDYLIQLKNRKNLKDVEISAHVLSFFLDGVETSSISLANVFYELAKNPEWQQKLREELIKGQDESGTFSYDSLKENKLLENVIFESLRLHPIMHVHFRECTKDKELQINENEKFLLEKGTSTVIPVYNIHRDPKFYGSNAAEFNPDRFHEAGMKNFIDQGVFFPFGDGPRVCLGRQFALSQMKCCVAYFVTSFEFGISNAMSKHPRYDTFDFLLSYKSGVLLSLKHIK